MFSNRELLQSASPAYGAGCDATAAGAVRLVNSRGLPYFCGKVFAFTNRVGVILRETFDPNH